MSPMPVPQVEDAARFDAERAEELRKLQVGWGCRLQAGVAVVA